MSIRAKHAQQGGSGDGEPAYVVWDILAVLMDLRVAHQVSELQ
jgi:hypothetical protein